MFLLRFDWIPQPGQIWALLVVESIAALTSERREDFAPELHQPHRLPATQ